MYDIRTVGPEFASGLSQLWAVTFRQAYDGVHTLENIEAYCAANFSEEQAKAALADEAVDCRIAFRGAEALGFFLVKHHDCPISIDGSSSELKQIYILSSEYGSGLGQRLLDESFKAISEAGRDRVWLAVSDKNERARAFYAKHAFEPLGAGPTFEVGTDRLTSTILTRRLGEV